MVSRQRPRLKYITLVGKKETACDDPWHNVRTLIKLRMIMIIIELYMKYNRRFNTHGVTSVFFLIFIKMLRQLMFLLPIKFHAGKS